MSSARSGRAWRSSLLIGFYILAMAGAGTGAAPAAAAQTPPALSVTATPTAPGATAVWTLSLANAALVASSSCRTLVMPVCYEYQLQVRDTLGAVFPGGASAYAVTVGLGGGVAGDVQVTAAGSGGTTLTWETAASSAEQATLRISGVTNPAAGEDRVSVATSPAVSVATPLWIEPEAAVTMTSAVAGATGVTWTVGFQPEGGGAGPGTTLTVADQQGASFSGQPADYALTVGTASYTPSTVSLGTGGVDLSFPAGAFAAGAAASLQMRDVTNPAAAGQADRAMVSSTSATGQVAFQTTSAPFQFSSPASTGPTSPADATQTLDLGVGPLPVLPPVQLPAAGGGNWGLTFSQMGPNFTASQAGPASTTAAALGAPFAGGTQAPEYLVNGDVLAVPVTCYAPPQWTVACNVQVEDGSGSPLPFQVTGVRNGTVASSDGAAHSTQTSVWGTGYTIQQVAVDTALQLPQADPWGATPIPTSGVGCGPAGQCISITGASSVSGDTNNGNIWNPDPTVPAGLTMFPFADCSPSFGATDDRAVSAVAEIPLDSQSEKIQLVTTELVAPLDSVYISGSDDCATEETLAPFLLSSVPEAYDVFPPSASPQPASWQQMLTSGNIGFGNAKGGTFADTYTQADGPWTATQCGMNGCPVFYLWHAAQPLTLVQNPAAEIQLKAMPYKILYQPPGQGSSSSFSMSQTATSETDFTLGTGTSATEAVSDQITGGISAAFTETFGANSTWDLTTTETNTAANSQTNSLVWTSSAGQTWSSDQGLSALDNPATPPWEFDEFVLDVHPQFALWDESFCANYAPGCSAPAAGSKTAYTLIAAQPEQFDVAAGQLLSCAKGDPLPIPGSAAGAGAVETLSPADCASLLRLDPFAAAADQSVDPTQGVSGLFLAVKQIAAGAPGRGTNGSVSVTLTSSQTTTNQTSQTTSFDSEIDSSITNSAQAGLTFPMDEAGSSTAGGSVGFSNTISNGTSVTLTYTQSQTASTVTQESATATLQDESNPIDTNVSLDTRWDTLAFSVPQPQLTALAPQSGLSSGGTMLGLTGRNFTDGPLAVRFCPVQGGLCQAATDVNVASDLSATAKTPALGPGTYDVQIEEAGELSACTAASAADCQFTSQSLQSVVQQNGIDSPIVSGLTPAQGPDGGGTAVVLTGANLGDVSQVWFGTRTPQDNAGLLASFAATAGAVPPVAQAPFVALGQGEIVACAPPVAQAGTVWVSVYSPAGWSSVSPSDAFAYTSGVGSECSPAAAASPTPAVPAVIGLSPNSGPVPGGTLLTITGTGFADTPQPVACTLAGCAPGSTATLLLPPQVEFCATADADCVPATGVQLIDSTTLSAQVPAAATGPGPVDVEVGGSGGFSASSTAGRYTYLPAAAPNCGYTETIQVQVGITSQMTLFGIQYIPVYQSETVTVPCPGPGSVTVGASPAAAAAGLEAATITAGVFDPNDQPLAQAPVAFTTDLGQLAVSQAVYTGGDGVATDSLSLTTPLQAPATATVTALVYGATPLVNRTRVTFYPVPVVSALSVASGPAAGGTPLTITGSGFTGATAVDFGLTAATDFQVGAGGTVITLTVPPGFGSVGVRVANPAVESASGASGRFTYSFSSQTGPAGFQPQLGPQVTSLSPATGPVAGGTPVTLTGANFTGATAVLFGEAPATGVRVLSATEIAATAPPGTGPGSVDVSVTTPLATSAASAADRFAYLGLPAVTAIDPPNGPVGGGTLVTVGGTGFTTGTAVYFDGTASTQVTQVSDDEVKAVAPAGLQPGPVDVTVAAECAGADAPDATACGTSVPTLADRFTDLAAPVVTGLNPANGGTAGGNRVVIGGSGFTTVTGVFFGAQPALQVSRSTDGQITATAPPSPPGTVAVTVVTACATDATAGATACGVSVPDAAAHYTFTPGPAVTGITPAVGLLAGGTEIAITGTGLQAATAVRFGDAAASFSVRTDGEIDAKAPPAAAVGPVDVTVTVACGAALSTACGTSPMVAADRFAYLPLPQVTSVSPEAGASSGSTSVTLQGSGFATATGVSFGSVAATFKVASDGSIEATAPAGAAASAVDVTVTTACDATAAAEATSCGTSATAPGDTFTYYPLTPAPVVRRLGPGWNTLSVPFPLATTDLGQILSNPQALLAAYAYIGGRWIGLDWRHPRLPQQPMTGLYLYIGGSATVTATLTPAAGAVDIPALPPAPGAPTSVTLSRGWNLVGPSAAAGQESYADFLTSAPQGAVPLLIDPNGAAVPVTDPAAGAGEVENGYAYWIYSTGRDATLVGQVLNGRVNP